MKRQVSAGRRIWKVIRNILLFPIWMGTRIISWLLSMTLIVTTWAFRTCCVIGFAVGIICLITGAIRDWWQYLLLFGAVGIVWLIPYGISAMAEVFDALAEMIMDFWHTPPKPGEMKSAGLARDDNDPSPPKRLDTGLPAIPDSAGLESGGDIER